jgi:hypothetical protein
LEEFSHDAVPTYAILSHTWGKDNEEVSFRDVQQGKFEEAETRPIKIGGCCKQAKEDGHRYIWIDTCCIDKANAVELHEAINSMFQWYRRCFYLLCLSFGCSCRRHTSGSWIQIHVKPMVYERLDITGAFGIEKLAFLRFGVALPRE